MPRVSIALLWGALLSAPSLGQTAAAQSAVGDLPVRPDAAARRRVDPDAFPERPGAARRPSAGQGGAIPIPPAAASQAPATTTGRRTTGNMALVVGSSLATVLGLFFLFVWVSRRAFPKASATLPGDVLEVLGRAPLTSRQHLQLIRLGRRLVLLSVAAERAEALSEITDPDEVHQLCGLCRQQQPGSVSDSFRQVLQQLGASRSAPWSAAGREFEAGSTVGRRPPTSVS